MRNENKALLVVTVYIIVMLVISTVAVTLIRKNTNHSFESISETESESDIETQIVYIPVYSEREEENIEPEKENYFTVKSYEGKIGIFEADGRLYDIIDVYVKTLPEADKREIQKGFIIESEEELRKIREDYTG